MAQWLGRSDVSEPVIAYLNGVSLTEPARAAFYGKRTLSVKWLSMFSHFNGDGFIVIHS